MLTGLRQAGYARKLGQRGCMLASGNQVLPDMALAKDLL
jgi:hypothetical protein